VHTRDNQAGFRSLQISDWRQFDELSIEFDPRLTILTGANASGKSTILALLARHFNWSRVYSTAPVRSKARTKKWSPFGRRRSRAPSDPQHSAQSVGSLTYGSGNTTLITVSNSARDERAQYDISLPEQQSVTGLFLTSHRAVSGNYAQVSTIPTLFGTPEQMFEQFTNEVRTRWQGSWTGRTPQLALKESLIAAAVFGEGSASVERNDEAAAIWTGFQSVLGSILPPSLGYQRLRIRVPDIIVETNTGDFIFDEASGGLSALLEVAWQIFLRSRNHGSFTVLLDEPENHLHPSLQREILPSLLNAFPSVQFIVATHSPFVVTASPDSAVYALDYNTHRRVQSRRLDYTNKAASAEDTLHRVLGLESTLPTWAEQRFHQILDEHLGAGMTNESVTALRNALESSGLASQFPNAIVTAVDRTTDTDQV
jgi:predicted ATPase